MGSGHAKGAQFERKVCRQLSLWVSRGKRKDLFWRSAMSGGRATLGRKRGVDLAHQAGDITAVHPDGHALTEHFYIECKFYRSLDLELFLQGRGKLARFWRVACDEARHYGRTALLIAKQNHTPALLLFAGKAIMIVTDQGGFAVRVPQTLVSYTDGVSDQYDCVVLKLDRLVRRQKFNETSWVRNEVD